MERLSAIDGSFLRVESETAHMHVAWSALFKLEQGGARPTLAALRRSVQARLSRTPRFRRRLAYAPPGLGEPFLVDDPDFEVADHIVLLGARGEVLDDQRFAALRDRALSEPLDRSRPLWRIYLAPRINGGRCGMVAKIHHALVDGKSALEVALLLFDVTPEPQSDTSEPWRPDSPPTTARLALEALGGGAEDTLRAARGAARLATGPRSGSARLAGTLRRAALSVGDDLLRPAPASYLNKRISERRTLVVHRARLSDVLRVKRLTGATLNDVCLAGVTGALRELSLARGEPPRPLKAMVPVSVREDAERTSFGNRISLVFVELPVHVSSPRARLGLIQRETSRFKRAERAAGAEAVFSALGLLPELLRGPAARAVGSPRTYNLTVSNVPGPRFPLYMLGARLLESYPVVPIADGHALSVGIFSYLEHLHFGFYADPRALPDVQRLPEAMSVALLALGRSVGHRGRAHAATANSRVRAAVTTPRDQRAVEGRP